IFIELFFFIFFFFFFQAEDGIRDYKVTGVQTCALPIFNVVSPPWVTETLRALRMPLQGGLPAATVAQAYVRSVEGTETGRVISRSEERRVGKECRSRWTPDH